MGVDLLAAAEALLPARPDLAGAVATQAMDAAAAAGDRDGWLAAAGVVLGARGRFGDGRRTGIDLLAAARRWGPTALTAPAARRLRVELALLAAGAGAAETVRALVAPVLAAGTGGSDRALRPAARIALARSATDPVESTAALRAAREDCADDRAGRLARIEVVLVGAAIARHDGAARTAVEFAEEGLRLIDGDDKADDQDLRLSLVAESIAALLDVGDVPRARHRAEMAEALLRTTPGPRRQRALLQLTAVSAFAGVRDMADTVAALAAAAQEAADSDAPELEAICRSALGAIHEKAGRLDAALSEFQAGVDAQHRDRDREQRFVAAVDAHIALEAPAPSAPRASRSSVTPPSVRTSSAAEPAAIEPSEVGAAAGDPQADGISWFAGSAWGAESEARGEDRTDSAGSAVNDPWSGGAWSNGGHRVAAADASAEASTGRSARREVRTSGHTTNGHDRTAARRSRHAKPDPSQLRAQDPRDGREEREPAPELDPLAPDWAGAQELGSGRPADDRVVDSDDVQSWMQTAMEELDRVWGPLPGRDSAATSGQTGTTNGGAGTAAGRTAGNGTDAPGTGRAAADRSADRPAARRDASGGSADAGQRAFDDDPGRAGVDANPLWPPFGHRSVSAARKPGSNGSGSHRSVDAEEDGRSRRTAARVNSDTASNEPAEPEADEEWSLGRSARERTGEYGSGESVSGRSRRAARGRADERAAVDDASGGSRRRSHRSAGDERPQSPSARGASDERDGSASGGSRRLPDRSGELLEQSARGRADERGAAENAAGGSRRVPDPVEDELPQGRSAAGAIGVWGSDVNVSGGPRRAPDGSVGDDWPLGQPSRGATAERAAGGSRRAPDRSVSEEPWQGRSADATSESWRAPGDSVGDGRSLGQSARGAAGERARGGSRRAPDRSVGEEPRQGRSAAGAGGVRSSDVNVSGGSRRAPDDALGDGWPQGQPVRGAAAEGSTGGSRQALDRSVGEELLQGRPAAGAGGGRNSDVNATSESWRAPGDSIGDGRSLGQSARGAAGERARGGSRRAPDRSVEEELPQGRSGAAGVWGSDVNVSGGSWRAPDDALGDGWPLSQPSRGVDAERGSRRAPDRSVGEELPQGRSAAGAGGVRGSDVNVSGGSRRAADGSVGDGRSWDEPVRGRADERGAAENAAGGSRWMPDGALGDGRLGQPARSARAGGGSRRAPDGSAEDEWPLGRSSRSERGVAGDEPSELESAPDEWSAGRRRSADVEPWDEERTGRRSRAERDASGEPGVSTETDPLFALLRAPKAPVSKDALADLARRLTVAPQRLSITPDAPTDRSGTDDRNGSAHDASDSAGAPSETGAVGCTVVIDLARDGRRFAGVRAATVIREVAGLVAELVPAGSRVRFDEPDVLSLVLPGWEGPDATRWMYRTMPGLLAGFVASEDIRGVQLRATVHDVNGPVGAQLLHRIDGGRGGTAGRHGAAAEEPGPRRSDSEPEPSRTARTTREAADRAADRATDRAPERAPDRPPPRPIERAAHRAADRPGRRDVATATVATAPSDRVKPDTPAPAPTQAPFTPDEADGLGLADLLAGALAAYRSI